MKNINFKRQGIYIIITLLIAVGISLATVPVNAVTDTDIEQAIINGVAYLAGAQNADGSWGYYDKSAHTGLVLIKLQDRAYELGYSSPFDPSYPYSTNVINGWIFLFNNAYKRPINMQPAGNPDTNGNGYGIEWGPSSHEIYESGICLMALAASGTPSRPNEAGIDFDIDGTADTYKEVAQDVIDFLSWAQVESGSYRGGWRYTANDASSDNSISGYAVLGLAAAEAITARPGATPFACVVPNWVKTELNLWINYIQCKTAGPDYGGSGYAAPWSWVNLLKTGNLIFEMTFVGDLPTTPRFVDALSYIDLHWKDPCGTGTTTPGWGYNAYPAHYQAMYCLMKGLIYSGINFVDTDGDGFQDDSWYNQEPSASPAEDFASVLVAQQNADGSWPPAHWASSNPILNTAWALLTLEAIAPTPPADIVKIHPDHGYYPLGMQSQKTLYSISDMGQATGITTLEAYSLDATGTILTLAGSYNLPFHNLGAVGLALDDVHDQVFVTWESSGVIDVFDATNFNPIASIVTPGSNLAGIVVDTATNTLYVVDRYQTTIYMYNTATYAYLGTGTIGVGAIGLAYDSSRGHLYVTSSTNIVNVYNIAFTWVASYSVSPHIAAGIAVDYISDPAGAIFYTCENTGGPSGSTLCKYETSTGTLMTTGVYKPTGVTVDPQLGMVYVTRARTLQSIDVYDTNLNFRNRVNLPTNWFPTDLFIGEVRFDAGYLKPCSKITLIANPGWDIYWRYNWNGADYPDAADGDYFYNGEWWYLYDNLTDIHFDEECRHILYYFAKYGDEHGEIHKQTYYVDGTPPELNKQHPEHGYYPIDPPYVGYLKCNATITITADDIPGIPGSLCVSGVENIFWRYEFNRLSYPLPGEAGAVDGAVLGMLYDYTDPAILNYWWYYNITPASVEFHFEEECIHDLYYWAKDNVCNRGPIHHQTYYVDNTPPKITKTHPDPCYYPFNATAGIIKVGGRIILEAIDGGTYPCISGVEDIYYGFWYSGKWHPEDPFDEYCGNYNITMYKDGKWWYTYTHPIRFHEICKHTLMYWTKDNVCNTGPIHKQIYWVNDCQDVVWIDDNFGFTTPGFLHDHFVRKQLALDWLGPGGYAYVFDGVYYEDIILIDDIPCCDNTGITQMGEYGCFPIGESAVIVGSEHIFVDDVTIKYLEYTPNTNGSIVVYPDVSGTTLRCNKFRKECVSDAIGVKSLTSFSINAELNWWGVPNGPDGGLMDDGKTADGYGVKVIGDLVDVEPWIGIHAEIANPVGTFEVEVGTPIHFDSSESWAYTYGECCQEAELLPMQYEWNFDDGTYSHNKDPTHIYTSPGTYYVSLMVDAPGIPGLYANTMFDWDYVTIHAVLPDTPLTVSADGGNLGGYQTIVGEPVQLFGDAYCGDAEYLWHWDFGDDSTDSYLQNPTHIYETPGTFTATLMVTSGTEQASDTAEIQVYDIDELFVDISDGLTKVGVETMFSASIRGGTRPYSYLWDFGDGDTSTLSQPSHIYNSVGEYTMSVIVTDSRGISKSDSALLIVETETSIEPCEILSVSGGFGVNAIISTGTNPVHWMISVDGSVFIGGIGDGVLGSDLTERVNLPFTFGFGNVDITITANEITKEYSAFLFGPIFLNLQEI
jgi:PKD repeat protein